MESRKNLPTQTTPKSANHDAHLCVADSHVDFAWLELVCGLDAVQMARVQRVESVGDPCAPAELRIGRQVPASVNRRAEIVAVLQRLGFRV